MDFSAVIKGYDLRAGCLYQREFYGTSDLGWFKAFYLWVNQENFANFEKIKNQNL